ncbi:MAG TPA: hypothetical protein VNN17_05050 [Terriglobia bacterium]|nr:hypothetical protein [Terriglobia bacterium]
MLRRYWKTLVAVLGGNFLYYGVLYPYLPPEAQHQSYQIDLGLLVDFWICLALYGLLAFRFGRKGSEKEKQAKPD